MPEHLQQSERRGCVCLCPCLHVGLKLLLLLRCIVDEERLFIKGGSSEFLRKAKQAAKKTLIILSQDRDSPLPYCCEKTQWGESRLLFWSEVAVVTALALLKKVWEELLWMPSRCGNDSGQFCLVPDHRQHDHWER